MGILKTEHEKQKFKDRFSSFHQKAEKLQTKQNQCILILLTLATATAATFDAFHDFFPWSVSITLYVLAAAGFAMTCTLWAKAISIFVASVVLPILKCNRIINVLITNDRLRIVFTTIPGMGINLIYAVFHGVIGITARSAWYGSLSAYYLLLCLMRLLAVSYAGEIYTGKAQGDNRKKRECKVYRNCGIILFVSSIALGGAVIMLVMGYGGKSYSDLMIYAVASYTFCKLAMAIINKIKARKERSLLLMTLRNISYCDSFVSLLSLQTALFAAFGSGAGEFVPTMNAVTGAGVCLMIAGLGLYMVYDAKKKLQTKAQT